MTEGPYVAPTRQEVKDIEKAIRPFVDMYDKYYCTATTRDDAAPVIEVFDVTLGTLRAAKRVSMRLRGEKV